METEKLFDEYLNFLRDGNVNNIDKKKTFIRKEIFDYEKSSDKLFLEMEAYEIREMFAAFRSKGKPILSKGIIANHISFYKGFVQYCIDLEYVKGTNIFELKTLSTKEMYEYLHGKYADEAVLLITEDMYSDICKRIKKLRNYFYYEAVVRLLFEGVIANLVELPQIKESDVDLQGREITRNGRAISISGDLSRCLEINRTGDFDITSRSVDVVHIDNSFLKFPVKKSTDFSDICKIRNNIRDDICKRKFVDIYDVTGFKLTARQVYDSGLFNYIRKKVNDEELLNDMLFGNFNVNENTAFLTELSREYGSCYDGNQIRFRFTKYRR